MNKYIKNYLLNTLNTVMMTLFPIITFPYVTRVLGTNNLGIINFAQSYGYYFVHLASFGVNSYALREVSKVRDNKERVEVLSNEIFNINCFFSIISVILYFVGVVFTPNFRNNFIIFSLYSTVIVTNFLSIDWLLQSYDDYYFSTIRNFIIRLLSIIAVFIFIKRPEDYYIYMIITCITEMGVKFSTLAYSRRKYVNLRITTKFLNIKEHFHSLFTLFTFRLVNGISANLDKLMIGFMLLYSSVGIYSAGVKIVVLLQSIVETFGIVLFPRINISTNSSKEKYYDNLKINYNLILLLGLPMAVGLYLVSPRLILLISGEEYASAISVSRIMSAMIVLGPIGDMLGSKTLLIFKKDRWLLNCSICVAVSNVVLNFLLIPKRGINGAALASILSCMVSIITRYYYTNKILKVRLINTSLIKYSLFTVPFIAIYYYFGQLIDSNTIYMLIFVVGCSIIYFVELILSKDSLSMMLLRKVIKRI